MAEKYTKWPKKYKMAKKYTQWPKNIPIGHKIYQLAIKYTNWPYNTPTSSIAKPSKIYLNGDFWFETLPSGNPALTSFMQNRCTTYFSRHDFPIRQNMSYIHETKQNKFFLNEIDP
jgi:hypothetical protein